MKTKALELCLLAHDGQHRRDSLLPYAIHPLRVVNILSEFTRNETLITAALLHDVPEDTKVTLTTIADVFSETPEVAVLVEALTDTDEELAKHGSKLAYHKAKYKDASSDVLLIKLCDRLDNISDDPSPKYKSDTLEWLCYLEVIRTLTHAHSALITRIKEKILL